MTKKKKFLNVLGIMSGTSLDGADFVLCKIQNTPFQMKLLDHAHSKFPAKLKARLLRAAQHDLKVNELGLLHYDLGEFYASEAAKHKKKKKWNVELVGLHGQTVFHSSQTATLQIGEAGYLNQELKCPVVSDFRSLDIVYGGEGAPLATLFHKQVLAKNSSGPIAIQNLGGIGNVTYLNGSKILSFDTGPANMLMDLWIKLKKKKDFDKDGEFAARGLPDVLLLEKMLSHPFIKKTPPKSCGREEFGIKFLEKYKKNLSKLTFEDQMATLLEFTARSICMNYTRFLKPLPRKLYLCGGGAKNVLLKKRLQFHMPSVAIGFTEDLGWPTHVIEGAAFALLAAYRYWGLPSNVPQTTGAKKEISLGKIIDI